MKFLLTTIVLALASTVLWAIGSCARRISGARDGTWPTSIGVGLAIVVFVGGVLNLAHVAYGPVLWALIGLGMILGVIELGRVRIRLPQDPGGRVEMVAAGLVIALVTGFVVATQLPPRVFNSVDDFQKYFTHPVRMLATGTLLGSPLSALGSQTLGGQAFLHGFVLLALPIGYINGVDAVFGLFILMIMAAAAGWRRYLRFPGAMLGPLLIAAINPQYVNVTSLYLGSVLMATAVMLVADDREGDSPPPWILGLVYASLVAIKSSFALFVVLHFPFCLLAIGSGPGSARQAFGWGLRVCAWTGIGVAPWIALHLPNYLSTGMFGKEIIPEGADGKLNLLSTRELFYRASFADYTLIIGLTIVVGICAIISARPDGDAKRRRVSYGMLAGAGSCLLSFGIMVFALSRVFAGHNQSLRYSIPTILGCAVFVILLFPQLSLRLPRGVSAGVPALACIAVAAVFVPSMKARYRQTMESGSALAFSTLAQFPQYIEYNRFCLSEVVEKRIRDLQEKVPPGAPLVAWIDTPFLLDYKRNPIVDVEVGGLATSWAHIPKNAHYVLWQYRGFEGFGVLGISDYEKRMHVAGVQERLIGMRGLEFINHLKQLSAKSVLIANDGQIALFRTPDADGP